MFFSQAATEHTSIKNLPKNLHIIVNSEINLNELTSVPEIAEVYRDPANNLSQLPVETLLDHIVPFIHDEVIRELHKRALLYKEYMDIKDNINIKLNKYQGQIKWYGNEFNEVSKIFLLPEELEFVKSEKFALNNQQCEKLLEYISKLLSQLPRDNLDIELQGILTDSQEKQFQHTFSYYMRLRHAILDHPYRNWVALLSVILAIIYSVTILADPFHIKNDNVFIAIWPELAMLAFTILITFPAFFDDTIIVRKHQLQEKFDIKVMAQDICDRLEKIANKILDLNLDDSKQFIIKIPDLIPEFSAQTFVDENERDLEAGIMPSAVKLNNTIRS
jgi:hypothetical protein